MLVLRDRFCDAATVFAYGHGRQDKLIAPLAQSHAEFAWDDTAPEITADFSEIAAFFDAYPGQ